jgi:hypothetical protein
MPLQMNSGLALWVMSEIVNKVAESALYTLDLAKYYPAEDSIRVFDLKPFLFMELILKEKDFREALKNHNWEDYRDKHVGVTCSADAIIPVWAYMLVASYLEPVAKSVHMAGEEDIRNVVLQSNLRDLDVNDLKDVRVVVKGCGELPISNEAYMHITAKLRPVAKSIMYGEPCSTVPIFKKKSSEQ